MESRSRVGSVFQRPVDNALIFVVSDHIIAVYALIFSVYEGIFGNYDPSFRDYDGKIAGNEGIGGVSGRNFCVYGYEFGVCRLSSVVEGPGFCNNSSKSNKGAGVPFYDSGASYDSGLLYDDPSSPQPMRRKMAKVKLGLKNLTPSHQRIATF
jgi:hypothetical protein